MSSSVLKKQVMGVTGLLLSGFLISHLAGNTLIYVGPKAFNMYAHTLISNPLIVVAEIILAMIFFVHIGLALKLTIENKQARPVKYHYKKNTGRGATFASSTMPYTGMVILLFILSHIYAMRINPAFNIDNFSVSYDGVLMRDLHAVVMNIFTSPIVVIWYVFSVLALGIHVSHGFWSAFQSIGCDNPRYSNKLKLASKLYAILITIGFGSFPIYCFISQRGM